METNVPQDQMSEWENILGMPGELTSENDAVEGVEVVPHGDALQVGNFIEPGLVDDRSTHIAATNVSDTLWRKS